MMVRRVFSNSPCHSNSGYCSRICVWPKSDGTSPCTTLRNPSCFFLLRLIYRSTPAPAQVKNYHQAYLHSTYIELLHEDPTGREAQHIVLQSSNEAKHLHHWL